MAHLEDFYPRGGGEKEERGGGSGGGTKRREGNDIARDCVMDAAALSEGGVPMHSEEFVFHMYAVVIYMRAMLLFHADRG